MMGKEVYIREPGVDDCEHLGVCEHACRMGCRAYKPRVDVDMLLELADICESTGDMYAAIHSESVGGALRDLLREMAEFERKTARIIRKSLGVEHG